MKKGFTMIEIMAVFTVMAIILMMSIPQVTSMLKKSKEKQLDSFKNDLFLACEAYIAGENKEVEESSYIVTAKDMILTGYLDSTLVYPETNMKFSKMTTEELEKLIVRVDRDDEGYFIFNFYDNR